tara:strand:+ start:165 stop:923 length:759 start_codon:yes stop_codon:yes gene_type:complete
MSPRHTIVIPAYNEEQRLDSTLSALAIYLEQTPLADVILVDDGSTDNTRNLLANWTSNRARCCLITIHHSGKAVAVLTGLNRAKGDYIIFMDADLAVPLGEVPRLLKALSEGAEVVLGTREGTDSIRNNESRFRHVRGRLFNLFVSLVAIRGISDTQCGFKGFTKKASTQISKYMHVHSGHNPAPSGPSVTAFDVEILFIAKKLNFAIRELSVEWNNVEGSKVDSIRDPIRMAKSVLAIRINSWLGRYEPKI